MAEVKQVSTGSKLESIGTVKTVVGEVKAVDAAGNERILQAGDKVFANETIVTANGGMVMIEFADGTHLDLASASKIVLDPDVFNPANAAAAPEGKELTAEQIQEMIARGEDPTAVTEASAAGAGAGDEGGSSFIQVGFNNAQGNVTSGFNTQGIPGPESTTFTELPPVEDDAVTLVALVDDVPLVDVPGEQGPGEEEVPGTIKNGNNGFGNGDQDAPGNSGPHNNAENAADNNGGNNGNGGENGNNGNNENAGDNGNNGYGNGDQDAPGGSGPNNNAENATDNTGDNNGNAGENGNNGNNDNNENSSNNGNNGYGNGDQDAPGGSQPNNNAENASGNTGGNNGNNGSNENNGNNGNNENDENNNGNNGYGNGDQDAPGNSLESNNAENDQDEVAGVELKGNNQNDVLIGGNGDDILIGGGGDDTLTGGLGADNFKWESNDLKKTDAGDTVTDFNVAQGDTLNFDDLLSKTGGTLGLVEDGGNTTVTLTTASGTVNLVTLTGVTGETLNTLLNTSTPD